MLLKINVKIQGTILPTLIKFESITLAVPNASSTQLYLLNIAVPLDAQIDFDTYIKAVSEISKEKELIEHNGNILDLSK